jgi:hypothetical protein
MAVVPHLTLEIVGLVSSPTATPTSRRVFVPDTVWDHDRVVEVAIAVPAEEGPTASNASAILLL